MEMPSQISWSSQPLTGKLMGSLAARADTFKGSKNPAISCSLYPMKTAFSA
jgi:hypothetical protein